MLCPLSLPWPLLTTPLFSVFHLWPMAIVALFCFAGRMSYMKLQYGSDCVSVCARAELSHCDSCLCVCVWFLKHLT